MAPPSTASTTDHYYSHSITDLLEPALDGPPSPEGIRAFSRHMKRGSIAELATSSGSSSLRSATPETPYWDRSLENLGLSRNPSQRSSGMPLKERPDSVQLFGKAVFNRKGKLRRENSDQNFSGGSLLSLTEMPTESVPDLPKEQRFIQAMFTRRRPRGTSEASQRKLQISGPYDFHHVSHTPKESVSGIEQVNRNELSGFSTTRPRKMTDASNTSESLNSQTFDKPLPTPPSPAQDLQSISSRDSIQFSPPRPPRFGFDNAHVSPIPPPPRTSSRISIRHDKSDSFGTATLERSGTDGSGHHQTQPFILPSTDSFQPALTSHVPTGHSGQDLATGDERFSYLASTNDAAWPLTSSMTGSMTSLPEVPEEEEYHLTAIESRMSLMSNATSLRGSISVPHLRRVSLNQNMQRPPSNASDTLGRFDLFAAQRALRESDYEDMEDADNVRDSWEDDIDYCYDHEAEADCDFAWERPSCELEREDFYIGDLAPSRQVVSVSSSFGPMSSGLLSASTGEFPALSPTSHEWKATRHEATTPTSSTMPVTSNFSLPRIDSSTQLQRDRDQLHSSSSSFQEEQGFCLSPSLLIPNDFHEQMLQFDRSGLSEQASGDDPKVSQQDDQYLKFEKPAALLHARSSASTTMSTLSEQSILSSRHQSSTSSSSAFTRWTGSSSSSWQAHVESSQPPVSINIIDKESLVIPTSDVTMTKSDEASVLISNQDASREGHSRTQSDATMLMSGATDAVAPLESKIAREAPKIHRRARTTSRSHTNPPPQFALFPQVPQRP
ncbi:hypothetical protein F5Y19DRAFT_469963 [Xylariaceae sp. FL1651]|nr:hypothetical protein F5Y19DRAFT_469963 [Xylariaceae sp. FL1651]